MELDQDGKTAHSTPPNASDVDSKATERDSLVTVRLSEPSEPSSPTLTATPKPAPVRTLTGQTVTADMPPPTPSTITDDSDSEIFEPARRQLNTIPREIGKTGEEGQRESWPSEEEDEAVDWEGLQKKEDMESKTQRLDHSTASLLAKLEQENEKIAKAKANKPIDKRLPRDGQPRPPSMAQLRRLVNGPQPPALRYSTLPPTPMTELDFYLALVKDPKQTAARLPTLLTNKIRRGIPPPLRGVVWESMAGARDPDLQEVFMRLSGESSPYECVISKDLGRTFPGVEMFRDPDGDGQRMLGRVLKCFSLYDKEIGYCQGLAFLVAPLLMHMPDKQAFCVLVKLFQDDDLRQCFVPDLAGLKKIIFQFRELLKEVLPAVATHLEEHHVELAVLSQWFLGVFGVTCPLPMLFRIYDVIFAEGYLLTVMRVSLSLMQKNQARILACSEMEDVVRLLLSRGLWDCYGYNADAFVNDFTSLSDIVTKDRLAALEQGYRESSAANPRGFTDAAQASASRFLGRLWSAGTAALTPKSGATFATPTTSTPPATSLKNGANSNANNHATSSTTNATSRPLSMLRRSTSKQSLSSMEVSSSSTSSSSAASVFSSATSLSRDSAADEPPTTPATLHAPFAASKDSNKALHSQIEDLLTALSELQRNHALLTSQLQREREEREEDRRAVRSLLDGLRRRASVANGETPPDEEATSQPEPTAEQLSDLLTLVEERFSADPPPSDPETKTQLREEISRLKDDIAAERARCKDLDRRVQELEQEVSSMREQLRESHAHVRNMHQEKMRLERQIHTMRLRASDSGTSGSSGTSEWFPTLGRSSTSGSTSSNTSGLRELKLARSRSIPSQGVTVPSTKRASSLTVQQRKKSSESLVSLAATSSVAGVTTSSSAPAVQPTSEQDALLLELAQAKAAEAVAKQELEEVRRQLEQLKREVQTHNHGGAGNGVGVGVGGGLFGRLTGSSSMASVATSWGEQSPKGTTVLSGGGGTGGGGGGGFWGWRR